MPSTTTVVPPETLTTTTQTTPNLQIHAKTPPPPPDNNAKTTENSNTNTKQTPHRRKEKWPARSQDRQRSEQRKARKLIRLYVYLNQFRAISVSQPINHSSLKDDIHLVYQTVSFLFKAVENRLSFWERSCTVIRRKHYWCL
ncbi:hypothetical protein P8452_23722 [Trifolium repens]|nr:hypothetical protein P8452_23722 [Trifolium repens]